MLGEGLTTGAPVQQLRFDEAAFDRPPRRGLRRVSSMLAVVAVHRQRVEQATASRTGCSNP